ncbi:MAG: hypothetical protein EBQ92_03565 [Proteobacteria bacterium]|nr:hypothetical protein [Pseudomonadota bacterium]
MEIFIGIDQTGAVTADGKKAKPLPTCIAIKQRTGTWRFITEISGKPLQLSRFQPEVVRECFEQLQLDLNWKKTAFILDCVLGLPRQVSVGLPKGKPYLWECFGMAAGFSNGGKEFGRSVAETFFSHWLPQKKGDFPRRFCEEVSGSNSVFQTRPYQKNIQTGTFRIWKDLGSVGKPWVKIWPFEQKGRHTEEAWIFEGYPSLIWKQCLQSPSRDLKKLRGLCKKAIPQFEIDTWRHIERSPDMADSFVLAFGGVFLQGKRQLWVPSASFAKEPNAFREGWILGLKHPNDV